SPSPSTVTVGAKGSRNVTAGRTATTSPSPARSARIRDPHTLFRRANQLGHLGEHVEEIPGDAVCGSPDHLAAPRTEPDRDLPAVEIPQLLALDTRCDEVVHRNREDGVDLARARPPRIGMRRHADDGRDAEARRDGLDVVEAAEHPDVGGVQADL